MIEIFEKFPEIIRLLLEKLSQTEYGKDDPKIQAARNKLFNQLDKFTQELSDLQKQEGEALTEEQIEKILQIPRGNVMPWIKPK